MRRKLLHLQPSVRPSALLRSKTQRTHNIKPLSSCTVISIIPSTSSYWITSAGTAMTRMPFERSSSTTVSRRSVLAGRSLTATSMLSAAIRCAMPYLIPCVAPVTMTIRGCRLRGEPSEHRGREGRAWFRCMRMREGSLLIRLPERMQAFYAFSGLPG